MRRSVWGIASIGVLLIGCGRSGPAREQPAASRSGQPVPVGGSGSLAAGSGGAPEPAPPREPRAARAGAGGGRAERNVAVGTGGGSASSTSPAADARAWTASITAVKRGGTPAELIDVRAARNDGFDRVVFEFRGAVPGYHIEYVDSPIRDCGAGDVRPIAGDAWLEVRLSPAAAHTEAGAPTIAERERALTLPILRELELTCDFEAVVTWVLGVASPHRYAALELSEPPRLVVDVEHGASVSGIE